MFRAIVTSLGVLAVCAGCSNDRSDSGSEPAGGSSSDSGAGGQAAAGSSGREAAGSGGEVAVGGSGATAGSRSAEAGAAGEAGEPGAAGQPGAPSFELRALTFNTALAPDFEPNTDQRRPKIVAALAAAATDLDLMCVQEFWLGPDFDALATATRDSLPNTLHPVPKPGSGTCTAATLGPLDECLTAACPNAGGLDKVGCAQQACSEEVGALSGGCLGCIINNLDDFAHCVGAGTEPDDPAIFGGDNDVGLLSRYPLEQAESIPLDAYFVRTDVLHADVNIPNLGKVHVFCTHLGSSLGVIPYSGPYGSWDGEHAHQVTQLIDIIAQRATDSAPVILMGDLNTGPALPNMSAVLPSDYALLSARLENPYVLSGSAKCTECSDNSFRDASSDDDLIDHFLIENWPAATQNVERVLTEKFALDASTMSNLSDHYGLRMVVTSK